MVEDFTTVNENSYDRVSNENADIVVTKHLEQNIQKVLLSMEKSPSQHVIDKLLQYSETYK